MSAGASAVRRPLLNIVVLFASDSRVYAYSRLVAQRFADCGVDVFLQVRARARLRGPPPPRTRGRAAPAPPRLRAHPLSPDRFTPPASPPSCLFFCAARRRT